MSDGDKASPKRQALVDAATRLFSRYGLQRTTMEEIAREANAAKATAYAHFTNKEAVFTAVCEALMDRMIAHAEAAAAGERSPDRRVVALLLGKFLLEHELVHTSPHARELLEAGEHLGAAAFAKGRARFASLVAAEIVRGHGIDKREAKRVAEMLEASTGAIAARSKTARELRADATFFADLVLAGLGRRRA